MATLPPTKRRRDDGDTDSNENSSPGTRSIRPEQLTFFSWNREVKDMNPANLLQYIPSLPEKTQYFDTGLLIGAALKPDAYSAGFLSVWREIRMSKEFVFSYYDSPPEAIDKPACRDPLSSFIPKLRASITYHTLLEKAISRERVEPSLVHLSVEIAKKLLDYLVLCCLQSDQKQMDLYLPDHIEWFELAAATLRREAKNSSSEDETSTPSSSQAPPPMTGLLPEGNDKSLNYDRLVDHMIVKSSSSNVDPNTQWNNIHGQTAAKKLLRFTMITSLYTGKKVKNVLLFGPPGTGKTMLLEAAARLAGWTVLRITQDVVMQTYQGQSEKVIAAIFRKASESQPACIVIDDADFLFPRRSSNQSEAATSIRCCFKQAMSSAMENQGLQVMLIATTSSPEHLDDALMRTFTYRLYVKLPDQGEMLAIIRQELAVYNLDDDVTNQQLHDFTTELANTKTLSAYDVVRALETELPLLLEAVWNKAKYYREETLGNGEQVIIPCSKDEPGALKGSIAEFTADQYRRLKERKVTMADIKFVLRRTRSITTRKQIQWFDRYNEENGLKVV